MLPSCHIPWHFTHAHYASSCHVLADMLIKLCWVLCDSASFLIYKFPVHYKLATRIKNASASDDYTAIWHFGTVRTVTVNAWMPTSSHTTSVKLQLTPAKLLNERQIRKKSPLQSPWSVKPLTVRSKIFIFLIYPLIKLTISLQKFWKTTTNLRYLKLQRPTASITLCKVKVKE